MIRVLIADDQDLLRSGFRLILDREPDIDVVGDAANGAEALAMCATCAPDVILMDVRMPVLDGIAATERITDRVDAPRVLILTTFDLDELVYAALQAGASGFLLKDVKAADLADAIRTVHHGDALLAPSITRRLISRFVASQPHPAAKTALDQLTTREREVLVLIARGLSNAEIAESLVLSSATVKTHVGNIFAKIGARDRAQAVVKAYEHGLVPEPHRS
jgi:DNA-binding NarL/FixJ family response regulator